MDLRSIFEGGALSGGVPCCAGALLLDFILLKAYLLLYIAPEVELQQPQRFPRVDSRRLRPALPASRRGTQVHGQLGLGVLPNHLQPFLLQHSQLDPAS